MRVSSYTHDLKIQWYGVVPMSTFSEEGRQRVSISINTPPNLFQKEVIKSKLKSDDS